MKKKITTLAALLLAFAFFSLRNSAGVPAGPHQDNDGNVGVGAGAPDGAVMLFDGTRKMLDKQWVYWEGPGFAARMPIKWKMRIM